MKTPRSHKLSSAVANASIAGLTALVLLALGLAGCDKPAPKPTPEAMTPVKPAPEEVVKTSELKAEKPSTKVKFKRNKDNSCTWEIDGDDVDDILKADRKLRRATAAAPEQRAD